jgi:hypothetical protein
MARNASALLSDGALKQGREFDRAGQPITPEHKPNLLERQIEHLQRRFLLPAPIARTVAELAWRVA